ncbi:MAG TPA: acyltransferase [Streptosporangiaceae bacterium]
MPEASPEVVTEQTEQTEPTEQVAAVPVAGGAAPRHRLAWLDALRGIAALAVVFDHLSQYLLTGLRAHIYHWIDGGQYGVFVFFLISGYIVPASLERKGSVRTFWVSRVFRLYPLYLLAIGLAILLWAIGRGSLHGADGDPETSVLSQLLMMSNVLAGPNLPNVVWSLSYEMVFYLLLTGLFIGGVHKRSGWYALAFGGAAVVLGGLLPQQYFSHHMSNPRLIAAVADLVLIACLAIAVALRGTPRLLGAGLAGVIAVLLLAFNGGWIYPWEGLAILGLMFTGTALYRAEQGQYPWPRAIAVAVTTIGLGIAAGLWHSHAWHMSAGAETLWERKWFFAFFFAGLTFGGGLLLRHVRVPRWLAWLGLISYSLYLLHPLLVEMYYHSPWHRQHQSFDTQVLLFAVILVVLIAFSSATYLLVERPMQTLGRKVGKWLDTQFGPDRAPARAVGHAGVRDTSVAGRAQA